MLKNLRRSNGNLYGPDASLTETSIMAAILHTTGPVSTHNAAGRVRPFLSCITSNQFAEACHELETKGLGTAVMIKTDNRGCGKNCLVFLKVSPEDAVHGLESNPELGVTSEVYADSFRRLPPACITWKQRSTLLELGYVHENQVMPNE